MGTSEEVYPRLDTLVLVPDESYFYLLYRAVFPIENLENPNVRFIDVAQSS